MNIMLLEDDYSLRVIIKKELKKHSFNVYDFSNGDDAFLALGDEEYDLFLLDINIPGIDGYDFLRFLRRKEIFSPVIFISSFSDIDHLAKGYEYGCNDYIRKPFDMQELILRVKQQLEKDKQARSNVLQISEKITWNVVKKQLYKDDKLVKLTKKETSLIAFLVKNRHQYVDINDIMDGVWQDARSANSLRVLIFNLRQKLEEDIIDNAKGVGYKLLSFEE